MTKSPTIDEALQRYKGRPSGFDYLRVALALSVIIWHSFQICIPGLTLAGWHRPLVAAILPMFFALSGFLVTGSLLRTPYAYEFVALRAIRILPALAMETVLSLLLIGSVFTSLSLRAYFLNPETLAYAANILGWVHFTLPGVFQTHPLATVNQSLWTIPYELECYLVLVLLRVFRILRSRTFLLLIVILLQVALPAQSLLQHGIPSSTWPVPGRSLVIAFLFGVALFLFRDRIRLNLGLFFVAAVAMMIFLYFPAISYFAPLPAAYVTLFVGLTNPPRTKLIDSGDYSYGLYLYGFPVQQALYGLGFTQWWEILVMAVPTAFGCAAFSWFIVEKPLLNRRKAIVGMLDSLFGLKHPIIRRKPPITPASSE